MKYLRKEVKNRFFCSRRAIIKQSIGDEIRIGRRGSMNGIVTVYGKSGHSAFAGSYINPAALAKVISKLKSSSLDNGTKFMPPSNLGFTKMNVIIYLKVVPQSASAKFNAQI